MIQLVSSGFSLNNEKRLNRLLFFFLHSVPSFSTSLLLKPAPRCVTVCVRADTLLSHGHSSIPALFFFILRVICDMPGPIITHVKPANSSEVRALVFVVLRSLLSALWDLRVREAVTLGNTDFAVSQAISSIAIVQKLAFSV